MGFSFRVSRATGVLRLQSVLVLSDAGCSTGGRGRRAAVSGDRSVELGPRVWGATGTWGSARQVWMHKHAHTLIVQHHLDLAPFRAMLTLHFRVNLYVVGNWSCGMDYFKTELKLFQWRQAMSVCVCVFVCVFRLQPLCIKGLTGEEVIKVAAGSHHSLALTAHCQVTNIRTRLINIICPPLFLTIPTNFFLP